MAKRQKNTLVSAAFHYLVKGTPRGDGSGAYDESGFTEDEFRKILKRIEDTSKLNDKDDAVVSAIKAGTEIPFTYFEELETGLFFGDFEGAYYGQRYRNNLLGAIDPHSLNLRRFHYLLTMTREGKIVVGVTYHGIFGDYEGLHKCFTYLLRGNHRILSKTLKSISSEIGSGQPVEVKLTYRKKADRVERKGLFDTSGVIAVKSSEFGEDFDNKVAEIARASKGTELERKKLIAEIVNQGDLIELDSDEIIGCSAVIRQQGKHRTVYFIGDNNNSTKFPLDTEINQEGMTDREQVKREIVRVMRKHITPLLP
ncbi:hypothetical protein [Sphingomonas sp.]|uniref:hypothetical protein n=1 Tax=Sphingomonas sp. TaxID=28214 RepID=UPI002FDADEE5